ncbi:hypothetical protein Ami103574_14395 [Aminipila butyrica]|uniref:Copper amine oxidase-like N-terminal domain-containing protein n=1 Tax=Aminipila butyrica TaxID=433296 RepID=A0A858BYW2_9FIRM|nr:WG repeat-containing protein [Aminipila butyrica]QIB70409.1 hypothetical protein Ami103574_14395 [Aminipila butyrica]
MKKRICLSISLLLILSSISVSAETGAETYDSVGPSYDGVRKVIMYLGTPDYKYGYIDEEGKVLAECRYKEASDFTNGIGTLQEGNTIFAINTKGEKIKTFDSSFTSVSYFDGEKGIATKDGLMYLMDQDGKLASRGYQKLLYDPFSSFRGIGAMSNDKYGVIDWHGNILTAFEYATFWNTASNTSGVVAAEKQLYGIGGYIGIDGKVLVPPVYDFIGGFSGDRGRLGKAGKYGIIDGAGNPITGLIYDNVEDYSEGLAEVLKDGKWGYIDRSGNLVIPCQYTATQGFTNGYATAYTADNKELTIESPIKQSRKINVYVNNKWLYLDQEPVLDNNRTLAPLRGIAEALDYNVDWDASTNTATLQNNSRIIQLKVGEDKAVVNIFDDGRAPEEIFLDVPARNLNSRVMVPVRFIAESIGADVTWEQETQRINIKASL